MRTPLGLVVVALLAGACSRGANRESPEVAFEPHFVFRVDGLAAFPDHVFYAYPCNQLQSESVATSHAHVVLRDKQEVAVREGGGLCVVYAVAAREYANFSHAYTPSKGPTDPAMDAFRERSLRCGQPDVSFDAKRRVEQVLAVTTVTASGCEMKSSAGPQKVDVR